MSDSEVRRFGPGSAVLLEDTAGKSHLTQIVSDEDGLAGIVLLPERSTGRGRGCIPLLPIAQFTVLSLARTRRT